jgi:hypothetical protein
MPPIRSTAGVILVLALAGYPYVYLMARGAFLTHGARALEAAQSLGLGPWQGLFRVAIPLARPWLAGGAAWSPRNLCRLRRRRFSTVSAPDGHLQAWQACSIETARPLLLRSPSSPSRSRARASRAGALVTRQPMPAFRRPGWRYPARAAGRLAYATVCLRAGFVLPVLARWAVEVARSTSTRAPIDFTLRTALAAMAVATRSPSCSAMPRAEAGRCRGGVYCDLGYDSRYGARRAW